MSKQINHQSFIAKLPVTCLLLVPLITPFSANAAPLDEFVTTWQTDNYGVSSSTSIMLPMVGGPYEVDWDNDGVFDQSGLFNTTTHDYGEVRTVTIRIRGDFTAFRFAYEGDIEKLLSVDQWGTHAWTTMNNAFAGASNMTVPATDTPDFSAVTDLGYMFEDAALANPDTSGWDTSSVTDMSWMFASAQAASPDTSGWDTSLVTDMSGMFWGADSANPVVSGWDTSSVQYMDYMFQYATAFDRDVGVWDVTSLTSAAKMFDGVTLSLANYESLLIGWNAQALQSGVTFSGGNSVYCSAPAAAARANMIGSDSWVITDGGQVCPSEADLAITKTDNLASATPGGSTTYTIVATNNGPSDVDDALVTDSFPASLTCTYTSVVDAGVSGNTASGAGNIGDTLVMPAGTSATYTASCDISGDASGVLSNTATVSSATYDPVLSNNSATDNTSLGGLSIILFEASPNPVPAGASTQVSWQVSGALNCTALGGPVEWPGSEIVPPVGSLDLSVAQPGCYTLELQCSDGDNTVEDFLTLEVLHADEVFGDGFETPCLAQ